MVPPKQEFPYPPKEICDRFPESLEYKNFINRALGHTDVKLTWEDPNMDRLDFVNKLTKEEKEKFDWSQYVGGDEDEDESQQEREIVETDEE